MPIGRWVLDEACRQAAVWAGEGLRIGISVNVSAHQLGREGFADADDRSRARLAGARDYRVAVAGERRVREVGVAVDEDRRASVRRGHLRSIQRSTGAAT